VSGIKAMGCKVQTDSFPADCETLVEGSVKLGDACTISSDCEGTAFCKMQTCPAVCSALLAAGDSCKKDEECGDDLVCNAGMCQKPSKQNEACVGTSGKVCAFGYSCWNGTDTTDGTCHSNAETLAGAKDDTCEPGGVLCMEGLSCVFDGVSQFHCEEKVGSGGNCHRGLPGQCPAGEFCNTATQGSVTEMGTCKTLPGDGEDCVQPGGACQAGLVCILETGTTTICRPIHDNGGSCKMDAACRSGYCDAAVCKPPPVCK
jgi:hypothetical protein